MALLVMFAIVPLFGFALYSGLKNREAAMGRAQEEALQLARIAAAEEAQTIREAQLLLQSLAAVPALRGGRASACEEILRQLQADSDRYANFGVAGPDGRVWCSALPMPQPVSVADRSYFQQAVETGRFAVGDYQVGRITGRQSMTFGYPVLDETGRVQAVLFAALDLKWLHRLPTQVKMPPDALVQVVDSEGTILGQHPDLRDVPADGKLRASLLGIIRQNGREGVTRYRDAGGPERLFAYAALNRGAGAPPLYVGVEVPTAVAFAESELVLWQNLTWLSVVGLVVLIATWLTAHEFILRPVHALTDAVKRMAGGDLSARSGLDRSPGELGELQEAFDEMAASVQQSTARLREAEAKYRALVDRSPAITYVAEFGSNARWQYVSPQIETILGFTPAEWLAETSTWLQHVDPADRDRVMAEEARCRESHQAFSCEYRMRTRKGDTVWVRDQAVVLRDVNDQPTGLSGIIHDITQLKSVEEALRESEERFRCLSSSSPMGILLTDVDGSCIYANPRLRDILGLSLAQALGNGWLESILPADRLRVKRAWTVCTRRGKEFSREFRVQNRQGTLRWLHVRTGVMVSDHGEWIGHVGTVVDITERKAAEEALRETNRRLEQTLAELRQTQQQAIQQERLRALGQLASGVAHDFNNALAKIIGFTQLLLSSPSKLTDPVKLTGYLDMINTAALDAANVVTRLREFYRKRDDHEVFHLIALNAVVERAVSLTEPKWRQQAQAHGVTITVQTETGEVPAIAGNEADLREALTNLIFNAVDAIVATARDGVITLRTHARDDRVILEIGDTGSGMTDEVRRHLFEPFFTTKGERGTGLGLAAVYGIIQRHGGQITVASEPGRGTTFCLDLPPCADQQPAAAVVVEEARSRPLRVLLAEDEPVLREIEVEYLTSDGHTVETASNGREALEKFLTGSFDLVVADQAMPEMNGDQLATAIKRASPRMPVIMVTGFGDMLEVTPGTTTGVDLIVGKPVTPAALRQAIRKVTAGGESVASAVHTQEAAPR